jgi:hypothetical protein
MSSAALHEIRTSRFLPGAAERAINAALSRGPGYERTPAGSHYEIERVRGYYIDFSSKTRSPIASDTDRVLPVALVQLGLGWWERLLEGETNARIPLLRVCELLEARGHVARDEIRWTAEVPVPKYRVSPGSSSALTQGQAASLFVRVHLETGDRRYADLALRAATPLLAEDSTDLVTRTALGPVLQETPSTPPSYILNGWISALWGLRDIALGLDHRPAADAFQAGVDCLLRHLPSYDTGWWSLYSLYPHALQDLAKPIYHRYHVDQLAVMNRLTGVEQFGQTAARWAGYDRPLLLSCALAQKALFAVSDHPRRSRWSADYAAAVTAPPAM